ncbi:Hypothetical predicted protein [Mytilus galloprovincialis]|uniref:Uncharacterized protein n=1 Tax=Mytilus galloprovincialis TaxID=29158 RepID=A0A8B6FU16_MYTGA|nr:Hypothetical predicted protein [Mytilus galloprovincialis]
MVIEWTSHTIRPSKHQNCPSGRPMVMYRIPDMYDSRSYLNPVLPNQIAVCREECTFRDEKPCDAKFFELCMIYLEELNKQLPDNRDDAVALYLTLRTELINDL